jgi:hypothetical protein
MHLVQGNSKPSVSASRWLSWTGRLIRRRGGGRQTLLTKTIIIISLLNNGLYVDSVVIWTRTYVLTSCIVLSASHFGHGIEMNNLPTPSGNLPQISFRN